jgi:hypothetical protein
LKHAPSAVFVDGCASHFSRFACPDCRIILCHGCWDKYDHINQRCPVITPPPANEQPERTCPMGHILHARRTNGQDLRCDECSIDLSRVGTSFLSCNHLDPVTGHSCDYDVCVGCQGPSPALERAERAFAHSPTVSPTMADATKVVAARRQSRVKPARQPSRYQTNRAKSAAPRAVAPGSAGSAAAAKKRKAKGSSIAAARAAKKQKTQRSKRSRPLEDESGGCTRRHRAR